MYAPKRARRQDFDNVKCQVVAKCTVRNCTKLYETVRYCTILYDTVRYCTIRCLSDRGWGSAGLSPNTRAGPRTGQGEISSCKTEKEQVEIRDDRDDGDDLRTT